MHTKKIVYYSVMPLEFIKQFIMKSLPLQWINSWLLFLMYPLMNDVLMDRLFPIFCYYKYLCNEYPYVYESLIWTNMIVTYFSRSRIASSMVSVFS